MQMTYRDTSQTYLQIFVEFMHNGEEIKGDFQFLFKNKKAKRSKTIEVLRKHYDGTHPEMLAFEPGIYSFKYADSVFTDVDIQLNKLNIIHLKVKMGTLRFFYADDKAMKPQYTAIITNTISGKEVGRQDCREMKEYPAGQYSIELNTLPPAKFVIGLGYSSEYELHIQKSAELAIIRPAGVSDVKICYLHHDVWKDVISIDKDYTMVDPLVLQPNLYKIVWMKDDMKFEKDFILRPESFSRADFVTD